MATTSNNARLEKTRFHVSVLVKRTTSSLSNFGKHRLQFDRSGALLAKPQVITVFLTNSGAIGLRIRQKLPSLGPNLATPLFENASIPKVRQAAGIFTAR